jgi:hypothetical protein
MNKQQRTTMDAEKVYELVKDTGFVGTDTGFGAVLQYDNDLKKWDLEYVFDDPSQGGYQSVMISGDVALDIIVGMAKRRLEADYEGAWRLGKRGVRGGKWLCDNGGYGSPDKCCGNNEAEAVVGAYLQFKSARDW